MFTGLVETVGSIDVAHTADDCLHLTITPASPFTDTRIGDSIAVNGVCLTVTATLGHQFQVSIVPETLRLTTLATLLPGSSVNLERALSAVSRLGGHYVQGHVDGVGEITQIEADGASAWLVTIRIPADCARYIVHKGYLGLDGMSITVVAIAANEVTVTLIPHTRAVTIAEHYRVGSRVNIEVDLLAKYVEKLVGSLA